MDREIATTMNEARAGAPGGDIALRLHGWARRHDDSWLFIISYITLAVALSTLISLFWLIAVVGVHFGLELIRHRARTCRGLHIVNRALWEIKLDIGLVIFALALGAYMEIIVGAAGLGGAARLGAQGAARAAGWTRALRGVLLSLDDVAQLGRAVASRGPEAADTCEPPGLTAPPWLSPGRWSLGDHIGIWLAAACAMLIILAPLLTDHTLPTLVSTLLSELHPWP